MFFHLQTLSTKPEDLFIHQLMAYPVFGFFSVDLLKKVGAVNCMIRYKG